MKTSGCVAIAALAVGLVLAGVGQSVDAAATSAATRPDLPKFRFRPTPGNLRDTDVARQASSQACRDILAALNSRSSNRLFSPDGTVIAETQYVRTLHWEVLEKARFAAGFDAYVAIHWPRVRQQFQARLESDNSRLERARANPEDSPPGAKSFDAWLYRFVETVPAVGPLALSPAQQRLDQSFISGAYAWVADADAIPRGNATGLWGRQQWIQHRNTAYAVQPAIYSELAGKRPRFGVDVSKLIAAHSPVEASFLRGSCAFEVSPAK